MTLRGLLALLVPLLVSGCASVDMTTSFVPRRNVPDDSPKLIIPWDDPNHNPVLRTGSGVVMLQLLFWHHKMPDQSNVTFIDDRSVMDFLQFRVGFPCRLATDEERAYFLKIYSDDFIAREAFRRKAVWKDRNGRLIFPDYVIIACLPISR